MSPKLIGKLITPAKYDSTYLYQVDIEEAGASRKGVGPRMSIEKDGAGNDITVYSLQYQSDGQASTGADLWDLAIPYKNSEPHPIIVRILIDGQPHKEDTPRVQDGM